MPRLILSDITRVEYRRIWPPSAEFNVLSSFKHTCNLEPLLHCCCNCHVFREHLHKYDLSLAALDICES